MLIMFFAPPSPGGPPPSGICPPGGPPGGGAAGSWLSAKRLLLNENRAVGEGPRDSYFTKASPVSAAISLALSGGRILGDIPPGENQHCRMALERPCENFCPLDTEPDAIILDRRKGCLRNSCQLGKLVLAVVLQLAKNTNRFTHRYFNAFSRGAKRFHPILL